MRRVLVALLAAFVVACATVAFAEARFPTKLYGDFEEAWKRASFLALGKPAPLDGVPCFPDKTPGMEVCAYTAGNVRVAIIGENPSDGIGIGSIRAWTYSLDDLPALSDVVVTIATIFDSDPINIKSLNRAVPRILTVNEPTQFPNFEGFTLVVGPEDGEITVLFMPPADHINNQ